MKISHALILASSLAFFACGDDSSSSPTYDCSVSNGVKIVYPAGGETFKVGDEITVVFGTDIEDDSYRIVFKNGDLDMGFELTDESIDNVVKDGKTCNEVKVKLDAERGVETTSTGIIRVAPYGDSGKGKNSAPFIVK